VNVFRVNTLFHSLPNTALASDAAIGLWVKAGSWIARSGSDGYLPRDAVRALGGDTAADELVRSKLWVRAKGGWRMLQNIATRSGKDIVLWSIERTDYRKKIPQWIRDAVFARDGHQCLDCGSVHDLTLDHIFPWSRGGRDTVANLRVLCRPCNSSKGARI